MHGLRDAPFHTFAGTTDKGQSLLSSKILAFLGLQPQVQRVPGTHLLRLAEAKATAWCAVSAASCPPEMWFSPLAVQHSGHCH